MVIVHILGYLLEVYFVLLIGRLVFDWVMVFARDWRPHGAMAALLEVIYSATDPPLRFLRRFIPPLRLGSVALDLSFLVLLIGIQVVAPILINL